VVLSFTQISYLSIDSCLRLSNGSLSPRKIFFELKKYENEQNAADVGYWIIFELLWRDFFKFIAVKYGTRLFYGRGLKSEPYVWKHDLTQFEAWRSKTIEIKTIIE
jgi:deoxyribodipyrimidine photo-lyase